MRWPWCILPDPHGPAELSMSSATSEGAIIFRERRSSPGVEFAARVHTPSVNRVVPQERVTFRIQAKFFDVLVQPFADKAEFRILPEVAAIAADLAELKDFLILLRMMRLCGSKGIWMDVTRNGEDFLPGGRIFVHGKITDPTDEFTVIEQALVVARAYGIDGKVSISINDVLKLGERIGVFYKVIQGETEESVATFYVSEEPADVQPTSGVIFHGYVPFGDFLLHCIGGVTGRLERIGDKQYRLMLQGNCLHSCALTKKNQEMDEGELADICASIEKEMIARGISPIIVIDR